MARSTSESEREPLALSRTFPLLAGYWSFGQFWGLWVITVTGLLAGRKGTQ